MRQKRARKGEQNEQGGKSRKEPWRIEKRASGKKINEDEGQKSKGKKKGRNREREREIEKERERKSRSKTTGHYGVNGVTRNTPPRWPGNHGLCLRRVEKRR